MRINDVIVNNKNEGEDIIAALYLSTRLLRNISAGRGGTHLHSRQEECGEFEANWTITYILFKPCIHSVMFTWTTKLPNLFFFKVYIATWCTEPHKNKKIAMDRGVRGDSSGGIGWISSQMLCGFYYVNHWAPGICPTCAQWVVRQNRACVLWAALGIRGVAGGKLVICSSLNQHSEEIAVWQHLEESEAKDILGRLRALLQRLGQNQDSIC